MPIENKYVNLGVYTLKAYLMLIDNPGNDGISIRKLSDNTVVYEMYDLNENPAQIKIRISTRMKRAAKRYDGDAAVEHRCLAEVILGKSKEDLIEKYGEKVYADIVGTPLDPISTTAIAQIEEEMDKVAVKYSKLIADFTNKMYAERDRILHELADKKREIACGNVKAL